MTWTPRSKSSRWRTGPPPATSSTTSVRGSPSPPPRAPQANPSHLGSVGPVTLGRTKAKQYYIGDDPEEKLAAWSCPSSFMGTPRLQDRQGVVYEAMQLSGVVDFNVGGTIHVIINNQVGFTTAPENARSTLYCSDLGKAFRLPIFHVNGDDPMAVVRAFELAAEWRQDWGEDCIVDVVCYRRFGHNESDNPEFTQPLLYREIKRHKRTEEIMAQRLVEDGHATADLLDAIKAGVWSQYEKDFEAARTYKQRPTSHWVPTKWQGMRSPNEVSQRMPTGVDARLLREIGLRLCDVPAGFELHGSLTRILKAKRQRIEDGRGLDWATAESLAVGSLLLEGCHVRLTGQDVQRGTFSHRHCVVHDQVNGAEYTFLNELHLGPQETFVARNSILSELAVLGFELGYSYESPNALSIWEAQFGDFANNAQVMIDQFVCSGEHKWLQQSALTMLLPHGYDGQGAEHSSCRLERFLQLCDDDEDDVPLFTQDGNLKAIQKANWQVMNLTTPANYFHALRQQLKRDFRKPLVLAAPKALLRHKACTSSLEDMGYGSSFQRLLGERDPAIKNSPERVDRLIFCSGKIYFELLAARTRLGLTNVALVTVELIAPFPFDKVRDQMKLYSNVQRGDGVYPGNIIWCQEEPKNMGAWAYVRPRMVCVAREALGAALVLRFVGRRAAAAPATGLGKLHAMEQQARAGLRPRGSAGGTRRREGSGWQCEGEAQRAIRCDEALSTTGRSGPRALSTRRSGGEGAQHLAHGGGQRGAHGGAPTWPVNGPRAIDKNGISRKGSAPALLWRAISEPAAARPVQSPARVPRPRARRMAPGKKSGVAPRLVRGWSGKVCIPETTLAGKHKSALCNPSIAGIRHLRTDLQRVDDLEKLDLKYRFLSLEEKPRSSPRASLGTRGCARST
ncbi:unnamed protein product [Prorocentrum cordatum]|uniref:Transketolase-like pyrimidine-binding domain-containing protein n=1 Tax=Prorocentrum cordatum TaxID=2364126 RepID=A0ABN9WPL4_9DINO|nr:unnamed protein product [Polarella glacialis]